MVEILTNHLEQGWRALSANAGLRPAIAHAIAHHAQLMRVTTHEVNQRVGGGYAVKIYYIVHSSTYRYIY